MIALLRYAEVLELPLKRLFDFPYETESGAETIDAEPRIYPWSSTRARKEAYRSFLPFYTLRAAAGYFGRGETVEPEGWLEVPDMKLDKQMFVARAVGDSMLPKIHDGDFLVFRAEPEGTRQGKIVLAQYRGSHDPDTGGAYTVKKYNSTKTAGKHGQWQHREITLSPLNSKYKSVVLHPENESDFRIVAEFVKVLRST